jgi:hypothetical protein
MAAQLRHKIYVHSKTIITPAAQELGTSHKIFITSDKSKGLPQRGTRDSREFRPVMVFSIHVCYP